MKSYAYRHRPQTFEEIRGQEIQKNLLSFLAHNPEKSPRNIVISAPFGTGKTTVARVFGKALNCKAKRKPCLECENCKNFGNSSTFIELDSGAVGKVEQMKHIQESTFFSTKNFYRTILIDESHLLSSSAQQLLLKTLEENTGDLFFMFVTTEKHKMQPTILSRSLNIELDLLSNSEITSQLKKIAELEGLAPSKEVMRRIIIRSAGHCRDAVSALELFSLMGEEDFLKYYQSATQLVEDYIKLLLEGSGEIEGVISRMVAFPLFHLKQDFDDYIIKKFDNIPKEVSLNYIKNQQYLIDTVSWYTFLKSLSKAFSKNKQVKVSHGRFNR